MKNRSVSAIVGASTFAVALVGLAAPAPAVRANTTSAPAHAVSPHTAGVHRSDFNGDGFDDLVVPAPGEGLGSIARAGAITVVYGSASGLTGTNATTFTQDTPGVAGTAATRNFWGRAVTTGDFNGDGFDDIAIGSQQTVGAVSRAGTVTILWGSAGGITATGSVLFTATSANVAPAKTTYAYFGGTLAAGDFNGDGTDDLAVGIPGATIAGAVNAGGLTVLTGSSTGLIPTGAYIYQHHGPAGYPETGDGFATSLAAGELNGDIYDDLIVGTPFEDAGTVVDAGVVDVLLGSATGVYPVQDRSIVGGALPVATNRRLGRSVAVQSLSGTDQGWVYAAGRQSAGWIEKLDLVHNTLVIHSIGTPGSQHGLAMAFGQFSSASTSAMAIGEPYFNASAGGQVVIRDGANSTGLDQDTAGVPGHSEKGDAFGVGLAVGDYNGDGLDDLAVAVPFESINAIYHAGVFYVFQGDALGLAHSALTPKLWTQESPGIPGYSESRDLFGSF